MPEPVREMGLEDDVWFRFDDDCGLWLSGFEAGRVEEELGREDDGGSARTCDRDASSLGLAAVKLIGGAIWHGEADGLVVSNYRGVSKKIFHGNL